MRKTQTDESLVGRALWHKSQRKSTVGNNEKRLSRVKRAALQT